MYLINSHMKFKVVILFFISVLSIGCSNNSNNVQDKSESPSENVIKFLDIPIRGNISDFSYALCNRGFECLNESTPAFIGTFNNMDAIIVPMIRNNNVHTVYVQFYECNGTDAIYSYNKLFSQLLNNTKYIKEVGDFINQQYNSNFSVIKENNFTSVFTLKDNNINGKVSLFIINSSDNIYHLCMLYENLDKLVSDGSEL